MSSIQQYFQYNISGWMLGYIFRFINFKVRASCVSCLEGENFDSFHYCYELASNYHTRQHLLDFYTESYETVCDIMKIKSVLEDLHGFLTITLLQQGFSKAEIIQINTVDNILSLGQNKDMYEYMFNELWKTHPSGFLAMSAIKDQHARGRGIQSPDQHPTVKAVSSHMADQLYSPDDEQGNHS